jgi:NAD(P)-dependent dehydrogenase (short-subunit alcohol dehydrogenase family)
MRSDDFFTVNSEVVLITGCSGQLGGEYTRTFLGQGARVVGIDLHSTPAMQALLVEFPDFFFYSKADVTDKASLQHSLADIVAHVGVPTVLINNAAIDSPPSAPLAENGPFEDYPEESWDSVLNVNLKGVFLCCQVYGAAMAKAGKGSIINIASIYGAVSPDQSIYEYRRRRGEVFYKPVAYSASKSGVYNLTRYLAVYWAKQNVRVNSLTIAGVFNNQEQAFLDAYCGRIPIGRMAQVNEYNGAMLFLASPASRYMTGADLVVDGGWTAI